MEVLGLVAEAAGLVLTPAKRKAARATLAGWLDGWEGLDVSADLIAPVRSFLFTHDGPTHSLARFDAVILDRKARTKPKPLATTTKAVPRTGEGEREAAMRTALRAALGDATAEAWIEPTSIAMNCKSLTVACPDRFHAEHVTNHFKSALRALAKRIGGPEITEINITIERRT